MEKKRLRELARELELNHGEHLARWMAEVRSRSWRLADDPGAGASTASSAADLLALQLEERCGQILQALAGALASAGSLAAGAPELREPVRLLSFTAGWMAGAGLGVGDALALVHGLQAALPGTSPGFFRALQVAACEAYLAAVEQGHRVRRRDAMERAQVVCDLGDGPSVPCLFLTGDPDRRAMDAAVARLVTLALMRGAPRVVIDCEALDSPSLVLPEAARILLDYHLEVSRHAEAPVQLAVSGVEDQEGQAAQMLRGAGVELFDTVAAALKARG